MKPIKTIILLVILLSALILIVGCQKKSSLQTAQDDNMKEGTNPETMNFVAIKNPERVTHNTFSIVKPREWKEIPYTNNILVYLPPESDINDSLTEKYSMIVGFLQENNTDSLQEITENEIAKSEATLSALEFDNNYINARLGQLDGLMIKFTVGVQNKTLEVTQVRTIQGNRAYAFSQQCLQGECKYTDIFNEMIGSFEWKNPQ